MTQMSRCPACGAINRAIARFCHNCGKALGTVCLGKWKAVVFLDEQKLTDLEFEVST